jgi:hypothetical protein
MKRILILILASHIAINATAQNIYSDPNFLKAQNLLWSACYSLKSLDFERITGQNADEKKNETISALKKSVGSSRKYYEIIKLKYPKDDKQVIKLKQWIEVLEKIENDYLLKDNWQTEPIWALGYTMIKMDLEDIANRK